MKTIVDFGTNNAAIPLILTQRTHKKIIGVEIQKEAVEIAERNGAQRLALGNRGARLQ